MKRTSAFLLCFALLVCTAAGCAKKVDNGADKPAVLPLPFEGEAVTDEEGSTLVIGETVTDEQGKTFIVEPVTAENGSLVSAQTVPASSQGTTAPAGTVRPEGTTVAGQTLNPSITQVTERATSPDRLTQRPSSAQSTTVVAAVPTTAANHTTQPMPTTAPPPTTVPYKEPTVVYGSELSYTANGVTDSVKVVSHKCEPTADGMIMITFTTQPVSNAGVNSFITVGYNCYDSAGKRLNEKTLPVRVLLGIDGDTTQAVITAPLTATKVEFVNYS